MGAHPAVRVLSAGSLGGGSSQDQHLEGPLAVGMVAQIGSWSKMGQTVHWG